MIYNNTLSAKFISRPNRFIAKVEAEGETLTVHVKNTGRCKELLIPEAKVILQKAENPDRTTKYDLIAVYKKDRLINIDSSAPNKVFYEYLKSGGYMPDITQIKPETVYGSSRFDFYAETGNSKIFMEVKGVTLEENDVAMFPDAPTLRGVKHIYELIECVKTGFEAHIAFVIQMAGVKYFTPNIKTHPEFGKALAEANKAGVKISAFECVVSENSICASTPVPIRLI